jgi:acyl dehydratase
MADADKPGGAAPFYLDDLHVGQRFTSGSHVLDQAQIKEFASEFDPQPFHLDDEAAKATLFGGLAASGWHTAAVTMRLLVQSGLPIAGGIIGSGGELSWLNPARPGDTRVVSEIVEITPSRSRPNRGSVRVRSETRNQNGDVVQTFTARLVVPRRVASQFRYFQRRAGAVKVRKELRRPMSVPSSEAAAKPQQRSFWIPAVRSKIGSDVACGSRI